MAYNKHPYVRNGIPEPINALKSEQCKEKELPVISDADKGKALVVDGNKKSVWTAILPPMPEFNASKTYHLGLILNEEETAYVIAWVENE